MATLAVTYPNFINGQNADADQVNQNFEDIVTFSNNEVIQRDASVAFTGVPVLPTDAPTLGTHATSKTYVDSVSARCGGEWRRSATAQTFSAAATADFIWDIETEDSDGFWTSGTDLVVPAGKAGIYTVSAVVWGVTGLTTDNSGFAASIDFNGIGVPLATLAGRTSDCAGSWTGVLPDGGIVQVPVQNGTVGTPFTAKAYVTMYRISP